VEELYVYPTPGAPKGRVPGMENAHDKRAVTMCWPDPSEKTADKTIILKDDAVTKRAAELWARKMNTRGDLALGHGRWTDLERTLQGLEPSGWGLNGDGWMVFRSNLGTVSMKVFKAEQWAIGVAHRKSVAQSEALQAHRMMTVALISDSQAAIRRTMHLDPGTGQQLARAINTHAWALPTKGIKGAIHWVPGHLCIPGNAVTDRPANKAGAERGYAVGDWKYTSAANKTRRISEGRTAAQV
jgi:hypothetical protein